MTDDIVTRRYLGGKHGKGNPDWGSPGSSWDARRIADLPVDHGLRPASIVEIGRSSGAVLVHLQRQLPEARLSGFDITPGQLRLRQQHAANVIEYMAIGKPIFNLRLSWC